MKDEVKRIMKLVQEGKLSPDDAAELIEAFSEAPDEPKGTVESPSEGEAGSTESVSEDPIGRFISSIEKIGKDVAKNVNWNDIAGQVRQNVNKGVEAIKHAADEAKKGGGFSVFFGASQTKRVELPLHVPEGKTLRIEARSGDVSVQGGAELGSLIVDATFRSYDTEEAKKMADVYTPVLEESEHQVVFRQPEGQNMTTDLTVYVPTGVPVEVKLASGDVKIAGTQASVRVDGSSGDLSISEATGSIQLAQGSGDVKVKRCEASILAVETKSGDIRLEDVSGVIELKTSSGDVAVESGRPKTLSVEAASGDVSVDIATPVEGAVNITTVTGDVSVSIMDGSDCRVTLSTLRGSVSKSIELEDEVVEAQKIVGRLGQGNGTLDVSVVTGNVSLGLRDSSKS